MFYNNFYNIHTDALFPVLILFIYNIHTPGNWVAGSPLILSLQFFLFYLNSICQQREFPLFLVAVAGKFFSFLLLSFVEGIVAGVTFISCHLGGVFKGWLSSRAYLYCWLPELEVLRISSLY